MRKELRQYLKRFESNMKTARESGYTRNIPKRDRLRLLEVYRELTPDHSPKLILCNNCIVEILKELSKYYNNEIKSRHRTEEQLPPKADSTGAIGGIPSQLPTEGVETK